MEKLENSSETIEFCVYMHVNRINGKKYIGITSMNPIDRWQNGLGYRKNKHFNDAIIRYGWNNFDHLILFSGLSKEAACGIEQNLIKAYSTQDKRFGYNLTSGGDYFKHSKESRALMSKNRMGKGRGKRSPEAVANMKAAHAGGTPKVAVICIESGKTYDCINDAVRDTGINKKQISGCCRGVRHYNTAGGYHWKYA